MLYLLKLLDGWTWKQKCRDLFSAVCGSFLTPSQMVDVQQETFFRFMCIVWGFWCVSRWIAFRKRRKIYCIPRIYLRSFVHPWCFEDHVHISLKRWCCLNKVKTVMSVQFFKCLQVNKLMQKGGGGRADIEYHRICRPSLLTLQLWIVFFSCSAWTILDDIQPIHFFHELRDTTT